MSFPLTFSCTHPAILKLISEFTSENVLDVYFDDWVAATIKCLSINIVGNMDGYDLVLTFEQESKATEFLLKWS